MVAAKGVDMTDVSNEVGCQWDWKVKDCSFKIT